MRTHSNKAFTFIEMMVVVVILGVLAAIVVPQFGGVTDQARTSATEGGLGGVRSGIAGYRAKQLLAGNPPYPSLTDLRTKGVVLQSDMPSNPWSGLSEVQSVSQTQADNRSVSGATRYGWNYYVNNSSDPPRAVFYANSNDVTTTPDASGGFKTANEL